MIDKNILKKIDLYCEKKDQKFICIDGITCSGKSFFSKLLFKHLNKKYKKVLLISKDIFLLSRDKRIRLLPNLKKQIKFNQNELHYNQQKLKKLFEAIKKNKKIVFKSMYDRNSGKNTKKIIFNFSKPNIIIYEGLYTLENFKIDKKNILKILIIENIYISLIRKIKRIRDKKISIQNLISEFTNLHLASFQQYLKKYIFNICLDVKVHKFVKKKINQKKQFLLINNFLKKHLFYKN